MRKKSWKQVAAIVICAALLSGCTGENGQEKNTGRKEGQVVNIYGMMSLRKFMTNMHQILLKNTMLK